ncbi:glycosyltransferase family 4 protein [Rubellicoccus peritrichatus]|uniref:Glycosyltransferase family 4 protein n=1 Tax=Rubellicoccus peritrichatus TaxID=3080537 RepID=A0AAQ3QQ05_9BACT|nr:glycosyltransferase family 4 protein [Puniceicoccus sp. CR14]WOO39683.1 glycosyltransferase family 4 protein [Puniceicoccus sp. CR14]
MAEQSSKPTIVFFMHQTALGGAELASLGIIKKCREWSYPVKVITHKRGKLFDAFTEAAKGRQLEVPFPYPRQPLSWTRWPHFRQKGRAFLGNRHGKHILFSTDFLSLWAALQLKSKQDFVISLWQGEYGFNDDRCLEKWKQYGADKANLLCASEPIQQHAEASKQLNQKVHLLNPQIDTERFDPNQFNRSASRKKLGWSQEDSIAVCVGRIGSGKGQITLARKFAESSLRSKWKLYFAGPASEEDAQELNEICNKVPDQRMQWLGPVDSIPTLLSAADISLAPGTFQESFGLAHAEAVIMGNPLITFPVGAIPSVLGTDYPGFVNEAGDMNAFFTKWADTALVEKMKQDADIYRSKLIRRFGNDAWNANLFKILEKAP